MNERQSLHHSQYKLFVGVFSNYGGYNTKKSVSLADNEVQTFLEREENQYTKRKTESCVFSGFGVSISLVWEWKSTTGRFATSRFWPFTWKTSTVGKDKVNKWSRILWIENYDHSCFCNHDSTHFSILRVSAHTLRLLFEDCRFVYFHSLMNSAFLPSKGLLCLYDKQNNTWLLVDMEFLFSCSTWHLTRSLRSLVSYRVKHSKRNSISTRAQVLFSIYPPLSLFLYPSISWVKNNPIVMLEAASFFLCNVIVICHACNKTALGKLRPK